MNKKTKSFLVTTLSVAALTCGALGWANDGDGGKVALAEETSTTAISLVDGAACRIRTASDTETGSGIRFKATLDRTQWEALAASNEMTAGIMILPTDYITAAGGYTHSALDTAGKSYLDFPYTEEEVGEKTLLAASMVDILDQNYTRDFSGVAYLKSTTTFEGATEYDGAYYAYAEYSEENNSRSIYRIATGAYNDRSSAQVTTDYEYSVTYNEKTSYSPYSDAQREVLKGYLDGVVDIKKNAYAEVFVANNTDYYTSPYTVEKKSNAEYIVNYDTSVTAKGMLYKGERVKSLSVKEGKTSISLTDRIVYSQNAGVNEDGSVTLWPGIGSFNREGNFNSNGYGSGVGDYVNNYLGLEGNYGVGTVAEFTFTGNNMPQVMLFANEINGSMGWSDSYGVKDGKGYLIVNGWNTEHTTGTWGFGKDFLYCYGPDRISATSQPASATATNFTYESGKEYTTLAETLDDNTTYTYYVWSVVNASGTVDIKVALVNAENGNVVVKGTFATGKTKEYVDALGGNIIAYAGVKGEGVTTTFTYETPYAISELTIPNSGATVNYDESVTLVPSTGYFATNGYGSGVSKYVNNYIAFEGNYGVGTVAEFAFTGNNMPQVMLFADNINGCMSASYDNTVGGNGYLVTNGLYSSQYGGLTVDFLYCFGSTRIKQNLAETTATNFTYETGAAYDSLAETLQDGVTYRYYVWSEVNSSGTVDIKVALVNAADDTLVVKGTFATGETKATVEALGGNIIAYAGVKGSGVTTTFSYETPYAMPELPTSNSGATINPDGSVTLVGVRPPHAGYGSGVGPTGTKSNYVAFEGEYGVGTYIDVEFTGNNMPYVMFFADSINGYFGSNGTTDKGIVLTNGIVTYGNTANVETNIMTDRVQIWGPNRYKGNSVGDPETRTAELLAELTYCAALTQDGLNSDTYKNTRFRYVVGTYTDGTYVGIHIRLYNRDTNECLYENPILTTVQVSDITAGNIILFASAKGLGKNTTFSYSEPYQSAPSGTVSGAAVNPDGSVTLAPGIGSFNREGNFNSNGYGSGVGDYVNNYLGLEGNYGVGTVAEFTFTGNNMPQVMLFANEINGSMGWSDSYGVKDGKGYLIVNGWNTEHTTGTWSFGKDFLYCYGPDRISATSQPASATSTNFTYESGKEYTTLAETLQDGVTYRYYVWSEVNLGGTVDIRVRLVNAADDTVVVEGTFATGKTKEYVEALGGNIIAYAGVKGEGVTTTFSYETPYEKEADAVLFNDATVNDDGSVTLTGKGSLTAGWSSGLSQSLDNSYIAYNGEYILGTEVAFTFQGNNLPQVMLFADNINGDMSKVGGKGILLMNGLYTTHNSTYEGENVLACFGPNRVFDNYSDLVNNRLPQYNVLVGFESGYEWATLEEDASYKYVVWTEEVDGKIVVCVELYNAVTLELLSKGSYATGVCVNDIAAGAIVAYAAVKGAGNDTTFFYHEAKMHEDTMSFYTYGTPGTYTTEAEDDNDLATETVIADYVASGMNTMVLAGNNGFTGTTAWAESQTKAVMDMARELGVEKFIINDARLNAGLCIEGSLIGDGCRFASEAALDVYVMSCIDDYVAEEGFYGLILKDEPGYTYATSMGQLYRSIKRVAEAMNTEIYVQINLLPMDVAVRANYMAEATDSLYADYKSYVSLFLETTGTDLICVDKYPFMPSAFNTNYYSTYKALAEACDEYGAEFGFVLQSYTSKYVRKVSQAEMNLQMNAALAFGAKEISFFTYVPNPTEVTESVYDYSFVDLQGNKTDVYTYAQNAIADAKALEKLLAEYEYVGAAMSYKLRDEEFADDTFTKLSSYVSDGDEAPWTVITEAYNDRTDSYLYTVINAEAQDATNVTVTLTFAGCAQAYVIVDGVGSTVDLTDGVYTANLALGEAVYIIPLA